MSDIFTVFRNKLNVYFPNHEGLDSIIMNSPYLNDFFALDESITREDILRFIDTYEKSIMESGMLDELLKNELLKVDNTVYRTKVSKITPDYFRGLFQNIRESKFDYETVTLYLDIIKVINIYGIDCDAEQLRDILESGIYRTTKNINLVSDGDRILSDEELRDKSTTLLRWKQICGPAIIDKVFSLDTLLERLIGLLESDRPELIPYQDKIEEMIKITKSGIYIRDNGEVLEDFDIDSINSVFAMYEDMNRELVLESLNQGEFSLIHFVQTEEVSYRLVGNSVINLNRGSSDEAKYNSEQNDFFINSYLEKVKKEIEDKTLEPFDITNGYHRELLQTYLDYFNFTLNNKPLDRLPMDIREKGDILTEYVRPSSSRLSCSFVSNEKMKTHLNRTVGLVIRPISNEAILSMSTGYTSEKDYKDFKADSISYIDLINQIDGSNITNETVVDGSLCEVVAVVVLDDNELSNARATKLAESYQVPVIRRESSLKKR